MRNGRLIGIDLFAGAGGMSLGFEQAGFDIVAAVELDPIHGAIHERNFPNCETICASVLGLTGAEIRRRAGIGNRTVDVVFGGPPCQGFSLIGKRALDDPRNALVREFLRIVAELKTNYFVLENVKGITVGKHARFLKDLISEFEAKGYRVVKPWKVLNAANYGVPQDRERLFLIGVRKGIAMPRYPGAKHRPAATLQDLEGLEEGPSCADALGDVPDAEKYGKLLTSDTARVRWGKPSAYASALRGLTRESDDFSYRRKYDPNILTSSLRTSHTLESRARFASTAEGAVERRSRFYKLSSQGVSNTLRAGTDSARGAFTSPRPIHYRYARCVTVREMARLHGFPDWFRFHVTKWHGARQIGNAVPPPLARAVAASIAEAMGYKASVPREVLKPDDTLLSLDMREAAKHFGIKVPIAQRVRADKPAEPAVLGWSSEQADPNYGFVE